MLYIGAIRYFQKENIADKLKKKKLMQANNSYPVCKIKLLISFQKMRNVYLVFGLVST